MQAIHYKIAQTQNTYKSLLSFQTSLCPLSSVADEYLAVLVSLALSIHLNACTQWLALWYYIEQYNDTC